MKNTKYSKNLKESTLLEADGVLDTADSSAEIADEIADYVADSTEGETSISDEIADEIATEVKDASDVIAADAAAVDVDSDYLGVENAVTKTLDLALAKSLTNKRRGGKFGNNVLIVGLPGSGKTASVEDWAKANNINLVAVNAKNNDLDAYINGYTTKNPDNPRKVTQAFSDNLAKLDEPRSVLFLDEYNRQVKPHIRASLYTLINEHKIVGEGKNNQHYFENMLFTIAAINPAVATDRGAAPLNDAEKSRFLYKLKNMDSDAATTIEFLNKYTSKKIKELVPEDEYYREDLESYLRVLDLGVYIVSHPKFMYDTKDDLDDLADLDATMLNQRTLVEGLVSADGDAEVFKYWVETSSDFLPGDVDMLLSILRTYIVPSFEELCKGHSISTPETPKAVEKDTTASDVTDLEDDDDFFTSGPAGKARVKNAYEVEIAIANALKEW